MLITESNYRATGPESLLRHHAFARFAAKNLLSLRHGNIRAPALADPGLHVYPKRMG